MPNRSIELIVTRQIEFQKSMKSNSITMYLALVEELGECVASMGYCDWKPAKRDAANIEIELVDIAVFAINLAYYATDIYVPATQHSIFDEKILIKEIIKALADGKYSDIYHMIFEYNPHLIEVLTAKQALNKLRQDYGYREGKYVKDWNDQEDNTYLEDFYTLSYADIYLEMEKIYLTKIIGGSLLNTWED